MNNDSDNSLLAVEKIPWPYNRITVLRPIWNNPIFQRRYTKFKNPVGTVPDPDVEEEPRVKIPLWHIALIVGIPVALFFAGRWLLEYIRIMFPAVYINGPLIIWGLVLIGSLFFIVRYMFVTVPLRLQSLIHRDRQDSLLSTPLRDCELYYGEINSGLYLEISMLGGQVVTGIAVILLIFYTAGNFFDDNFSIVNVVVEWSLSLYMVACIYLFFVGMVSLIYHSACLYSMMMSITGAVLTAILQSILVLAVGGYLGLSVGLMLYSEPGQEVFLPFFRYFPVSMTVTLVTIGIAIFLTSRAGLLVFSKVRRRS